MENESQRIQMNPRNNHYTKRNVSLPGPYKQCDPAIASQKLQTDLLAIQNWFEKWKMKANESKSIHGTFTTRRETCPWPI
jgi:hypothetical protein